MEQRIDIGEIYRWWSIFRPAGEIVEIRVVGPKTWSGYFHDPQSAVNALLANPELLHHNVFQVFNLTRENCGSRQQYGRFLPGVSTTADADIEARTWVLIDIDSVKPKDTNASDEQVDYTTKVVANKVYQFLVDQGFYPPVVVFSGNGAHLYLRCWLKPSDENTAIIKRFLAALAMLFDEEGKATVDPSVCNAARMAKLPGTMSGKGREDDPVYKQRMCHFVSVPEKIEVNDVALFQKVAAMLPDDSERPTRYNQWGHGTFDLQEFMQKYGIEVYRTVRAAGGTRYLLKNCIFDPNHKDGDAMIYQADNGALAYFCFHASCASYKWRDVRLHFDPNAYDRSDYADFQYRRRLRGKVARPEFVPQPETSEKGRKWLSTADIKTVDPRTLPKILTGVVALDRKIYGGLILGQLSVVSGRPGAGKTTFLNMLALNAVQQGVKTAIWSGELSGGLLKSWIHQAAAGRNNIRRAPGEEDIYYVPENIDTAIGKWLSDKLYIYNSEYGNDWAQLQKDIEEIVETEGVQFVILDNLMALSLDNEDGDKYEAQKRFIVQLHDYVRKHAVHIILVAHPRKQITFLRETDISGTADICNLADNVFILHRANQDFENQGKGFFPAAKITEMMSYGNVLEISKNRIPGTHAGDLIGLYFEPESKRMKNEIAEMVQYGWDESPEDQSLPLPVNEEFDNGFYNEPKEKDYGIARF